MPYSLVIENVTLFGDEVFPEVTQVQISLLRLDLIQFVWCPYNKRGNLNTETCRMKMISRTLRELTTCNHLQGEKARNKSVFGAI